MAFLHNTRSEQNLEHVLQAKCHNSSPAGRYGLNAPYMDLNMPEEEHQFVDPISWVTLESWGNAIRYPKQIRKTAGFCFRCISLSTFPSRSPWHQKEAETQIDKLKGSKRDCSTFASYIISSSYIQIIPNHQPRNQNSGLPEPGHASDLPVPVAMRIAAIRVGFTGTRYPKLGQYFLFIIFIEFMYSNSGILHNGNIVSLICKNNNKVVFVVSRKRATSWSVILLLKKTPTGGAILGTPRPPPKWHQRNAPMVPWVVCPVMCPLQFWRNLWLWIVQTALDQDVGNTSVGIYYYYYYDYYYDYYLFIYIYVCVLVCV